MKIPKNIDRICPGCMRELPEHSFICPSCGFARNEYAYGSALPAGTVLDGRYYVGRKIWEGRTGITYYGLDLYNRFRVIIKEFLPSGSATHEFVRKRGGSNQVVPLEPSDRDRLLALMEAFRREAAAQKEVPAKNLAQILDIVTVNKTVYLISTFHEGDSLMDVLFVRQKPIPVRELLDMLKPVLRSLRILHRKKLVHGDISPANLIEEADGTVVLVGAVACGKDSKGTVIWPQLMQNNVFAAPEWRQTEGRVGPAADVYSFCAVILYLVTGKLPFLDAGYAKESQAETRELLLNEKVPEKLIKILLGGMDPDPERRCKDADELYEALYRKQESRMTVDRTKPALSEKAVTLSSLIDPVSSKEEKDKAGNGQKILLWILTGMIVLALCGIGYLLVQIKTAKTPPVEAVAESGDGYREIDGEASVPSVADLYEEGRKKEKEGDLSGAVSCYRQAVEQGDADSAYRLGKIYFSMGNETQQNRAGSWFVKAAELGSVEALKELAYFYREGIGVKKNEEKAREYENAYLEAKNRS